MDGHFFNARAIGVLNGHYTRSQPLPTGGHLEQSDGTAWMGMFCLNMLTIALELAVHNRVYEDIAIKFFAEHPYILSAGGTTYTVAYLPAESDSGLFGGNSNWRGPIWFPVNYLLVESLQQFHHYYGDDFIVECPTGSGQCLTLNAIADELSHQLMRIFLRDEDGRRAVYGGNERFQHDPDWRDYVLFYEYFHGDNGAGVGASHQTSWTGLVAKLIQQQGEHHTMPAIETVAAAT